MLLIDPAARTGPGTAYRTSDPRHLLNVPAGRMSAFPDDPEHFLCWLGADRRSASPGDYLPRQVYGRYLTEVLERTEATCRRAVLHRVRDRVIAVRAPGSEGLFLRLAGGDEKRVDAAVLALGGLTPGDDWADAQLRGSGRFVADPWAPGALGGVPDDRDVLLVGTGLTMVDLAVTLVRPGRVVHALSRHGLLPGEHLLQPAPAAAPPVLSDTDTLDGLRREVLRYLSVNRRAHADWRPGMDGLRPVTAALWQRLSVADRSRFLREDLRTWEVHRHRMAPETAAAVREIMASGRLRVSKGEVTRTAQDEEAVEVRLTDGRRLRVGAVVNCTGAWTDVRRTADPLVRSLLDRGHARPGPACLGIDTSGDGRLVPGGSGTTAPLWVVGALRRGNLLETTAIPEIRVQAAEVASSVLSASTAPTAPTQYVHGRAGARPPVPDLPDFPLRPRGRVR